MSTGRNTARKNTARASAPASVSNMVVVALNRAQGIVFRLFKDGHEFKRIEIKGNAEKLRGKNKGIISVGVFGYTTINADDWAEIKKQYGGMQIFKSGLIFAAEKRARAEDEAEEKSELRHGSEPIDPLETKTEEHKAE